MGLRRFTQWTRRPLHRRIRQPRYGNDLRQSLGRPVQINSRQDENATYAYDEAGNLIEETVGKINVRYSYDSLNRRVETIDKDDNISRVAFDPEGSVTLVTDAKNNVIEQNVFDALGRRIRNIDAVGAESEFVYDKANNVIRIIDPSDQIVDMVYDTSGRMIRETNAKGTRSYIFDPAGNVVEATDRNDRVRRFEFDGKNQVVTEQWFGISADHHRVHERLRRYGQSGIDQRRIDHRFDCLQRRCVRTQVDRNEQSRSGNGADHGDAHAKRTVASGGNQRRDRR